MGMVGNTERPAYRKEYGIELCNRIVELEETVAELTRQLRAAEQKIERLQAKRTRTAELTFREPFYYAADGAVPYCPACFEANKAAVQLQRVFTHSERTRYDCKRCGKMYLVQRTAVERPI